MAACKPAAHTHGHLYKKLWNDNYIHSQMHQCDKEWCVNISLSTNSEYELVKNTGSVWNVFLNYTILYNYILLVTW